MKRCRFCAEEIQDAAVVCKHCGRNLTADRPAAVFRGAELAMGFGAFCLVASLLYVLLGGAEGWADTFPENSDKPGADSGSAPAPPPPPPPHEIAVFDATELRLPPGEHFDTTFVVHDPHSRTCTFHGRVEGVEGGQRDVEVYLLDKDGHANWHNRIEPVPLYKSGRSSAITMEYEIKPGRFHLLISNRYSVFTAKMVNVENARVICK